MQMASPPPDSYFCQQALARIAIGRQAPALFLQGKFVLCDLATYAAAVWPVEFLVMRK